jgi:serine/threonine protein kinase
MFPSANQQFHQYRLKRKLGEAHLGAVFEAINDAGAVVALKILAAERIYHKKAMDRIRLLQLLETYQHPHFLPMRQTLVTSDYVVVEMQRADGNLHDLQQCYLSETGKRIDAATVLHLLEQAAEALDAFSAGKSLEPLLRSRSFQHGGIHPGNLLLVRDTLLIADFGLASPPFRSPRNWDAHSQALYMAPELYEGRYTPRTDQYALAMVYCQLCPGERCLRTLNPSTSVWTCPIDSTSLRAHEFPVVMRALHPDWTRRYPSCREFIEALRVGVNTPRQRIQCRTINRAAADARPVQS